MKPEVSKNWKQLLLRYRGEEGNADIVLMLNLRTGQGDLYTASRLETNIVMRMLWKLWLRQEDEEKRRREGR